jgi:8-oxo-dGTP diphosphatase
MLAMDLCLERSSASWSDEDQQPRCRNPSAASNRQGIGTEARNQVPGTLASALSVISAMSLRARSSPAVAEAQIGARSLWKDVKTKNRRSGRKMSDAIFGTSKATGNVTIGDKKEIDRAVWQAARIRLTPTARYVRDKLFKH